MNFHNVKKVTMTERRLDNDTAWTTLKVRHGQHFEIDRDARQRIADRLGIDTKIVREVIRDLNGHQEGDIVEEITFFHDDDGFKFQIGEDD